MILREAVLLQTVTWTILLSVVVHGISASPLVARYGVDCQGGQDPGCQGGQQRVRVTT